jgi:hypothetical protein
MQDAYYRVFAKSSSAAGFGGGAFGLRFLFCAAGGFDL